MPKGNASVARYKRVLAALPKRVEMVADGILKRQAEQLAASIRAAVPKDTGALASTIKAVPGKKRLSYRVVAGGWKTTRGVGAYANNTAMLKLLGRKLTGQKLGSRYFYDYARAVEFGTEDGKVKAHPYFFRTYRRDKAAMRRYLVDECAAALKKAHDNG